MMMNEFDVTDAAILWEREDRTEHSSITRLANTLSNLVDWTNSHSDGWPYWSKPSNAAKRLQEVVDQTVRMYRAGVDQDLILDYVQRERVAALRPVKAFLTRQGAAHSEVIR